MKYLSLRLSPFIWFMVFIQFYYLYQMAATDDVGGISFSAMSIVLILLSMASVALWFQLITVAFSPQRALVVLGNMLGLLIYNGLIAYQFGSQELLNWAVIADNISSAFSLEAFDVIWHSLDVDALWYFLGISGVFFVLEYRFQAISRATASAPLMPKFLVVFVLYFICIFNPLDSYDPVVNFLRSIDHYYRSSFHATPSEVSDGDFLHEFTGSSQYHRPHIFLIVVESLNHSAIGREVNGRALTPFLNQLRYDSVYVEQFYGNSVQTAKGHFSLLFSFIPSIRGKVYTRYTNLDIQSIGTVLKQHGYDTTFFSAHDNKSFDNMDHFMSPQYGFNRFDIVNDYLTADDQPYMQRWGVNDERFFTRFFDYFDSRQFSGGDVPQFYVLATIANHFPFSSVPSDQRYIVSDPKGFTDHYANSVHLVDRGIRQFFDCLEDRGLDESSIVIITSDHAFPMGEHGNYHLEAGYHEESFRIPFFLIWKGRVAPNYITTQAYSQMDIVPSLLDLLDFSVKPHNFQGSSIFAQQHARRKPIYLIQPYGKHFMIIDWPYKYRFHTKTNREYVYHLEQDPLESHNIISQLTSDRIAYFRRHIQHIYNSQHVLQTNQIWPK